MNGYTGILENNEVSFEELVWRCARAFGPLIHMRDDSMDVPIRLPTADSVYSGTDYHKTQLRLAEVNLKRATSQTSRAIQIEIDSQYKTMQTEARAAIHKKNELRLRAQFLYNEVQAWVPPSSDHEGLKKFMTEQLDYVLKNDCDTSYYDRQLAEPKRTVEGWRKSLAEHAERDIKYHTEKLATENKGVDYAVKWITDLQAVVPFPKNTR